MEVFGHMRFALEDPAPMFEITLGDLAALVGLQVPAVSGLARPAPAPGRGSATSAAVANSPAAASSTGARPNDSSWMRA